MKFSRRHLLQGAAALGAAGALGRIGIANAQTAEKSAVVVVFMRGGYNALFGSADSFSGAGSFGCSPGNVKALGNGLVVDNATFGTNLSAATQAKMAQIGVNHGLSSHDSAELSLVSNGSRNYGLMLANAIGGTAPIRAAIVGGGALSGPTPAEGGVTLQRITDMGATINALGGGTADPTIPTRAAGAAALTASKGISQAALTANPNALKTLREGYDSAVAVLQAQTPVFSYATLAQAYGMAATTTAVNDFRSQMVAAELMITAGTNVVYAVTGFNWDTHGDSSGSSVRNMMNSTILPPLKTFTDRMLAATGLNVTVALIGDFARSLPGSDHASVLSSTVMGKYVKQGTTGRVSGAVGLPSGSPGISGFWSYLASVAKAPTNPFGANPHALVL